MLDTTGDSMAPTIVSGERVIVDTGHKTPTPDGLYAIRDTFECIVVKRLQVLRAARPTRVKVISDNPNSSERGNTARRTRNRRQGIVLPQIVLRSHRPSPSFQETRSPFKQRDGAPPACCWRRLTDSATRHRYGNTTIDNRPCFGYYAHLIFLQGRGPMPLAEQCTTPRGRPRQERDNERIDRAAAAARTGPNPAMAVASAQIGAAFDEAAIINSFKIKVERLIRLGPEHPAMRARFGTRTAMLYGRSLDASTIIVERWWRDERKAFPIASAFGRGTRLSLDAPE